MVDAGKPRLSVDPRRAAALLALGAGMLLSAVAAAYENVDLPRQDADLTDEYRERSAVPAASIPPAHVRTTEVRIPVRAITFDDLPEYPEHGLTKERIGALVEQLRQQYAGETETLAGGFTGTEAAELAETLAAFGARERPEDLGPDAFAELVAVLTAQRERRGLSYAELEDIANQVTRLYREQGLILANAYVPAQDVQDGVVTLSVLPGELADVVVGNAGHYDPARLAGVFQPQLGKAVDSRAVEESLYLLNDYPGLDVYGYFSPGESVGTTQLNMQVRDEERWRLTLRGDNYGSRFTGDERLLGMAELLNPTGIGDRLAIGYLESRSPVSSSLALARYSLPVGGPATRLELSFDRNEFSLADDTPELRLLDISGVNRTAAVSLKHQLRRGRVANLSVGGALTDKQTKLEAAVELPFPEEHVRGAELGIAGDVLSDRWRMINLFDARLGYGDFVSDVAEGRDSGFFKVGIDTAGLLFWTLPGTDYDSRLLLRSQLQYTDSALPAFEQLSLGGAQTVRAFTVSDFSADTAAYLTAEWYLPLPEGWNFTLPGSRRFNDVWQTALFVDGAYGMQNSFESGVDDEWAHLSGWGLLIKLNWRDRFTSALSVSKPMTHRSSMSGVGDEAGSFQTYLDFQWVLP